MRIIKRNGSYEEYQINKITNAINLAFKSVNQECSLEQMETIAKKVEEALGINNQNIDQINTL